MSTDDRREAAYRVRKAVTRLPPTPAPVASNDAGPSEVDKATIWVDFSDLSSGNARRNVRMQAARASAAARKATLAKKHARNPGQPGPVVFAKTNTPASTRAAHASQLARRLLADRDAATQSKVAADQNYFSRLIRIVIQLLDNTPLVLGSPGETSLAHSSVRTMLWDGMTISVTLFPVALFIAGTYSNTCGLARRDLEHDGPGMVILRSISMNAIQQKLTAIDRESIAPLAIALLAGWERRYGDAEAYEIHMRAWKSLGFAGPGLEEQNVANLMDLTLEMYRSALGERAASLPGDTAARTASFSDPLPIGFRVLDKRNEEGRSLLAITHHTTYYQSGSRADIPRLRRVALENMSWSPTHVHGLVPRPEYEADYDPLELKALYHLRAVNITVLGILIRNAMDTSGLPWDFDLKGGLYVHTQNCIHLGTSSLIGTKYQELGFWARFTLCAFSRDPTQDAYLSELRERMGFNDWTSARRSFEKFVYHPALFEDAFVKFFDILQGKTDLEVYGHDFERPDAVPSPR